MKQHWQYITILVAVNTLQAMTPAHEIVNLEYLKARFNNFGFNQGIAPSLVQPVASPFSAQQTMEPSYRCQFVRCQGRFTNSSSLRAHVKRWHEESDCGQCGKVCRDASELALHKTKYAWVHAHGAPQCNFCKRYYRNPERLEVHRHECGKSTPLFIMYQFHASRNSNETIPATSLSKTI